MCAKVCFFSGCYNSSHNAPQKIFITVPKKHETRKAWFLSALGVDTFPKAARFCCEDHFDLKNDFDNWQFYKRVGQSLQIKVGVVPRTLGAHVHKTKSQIDSGEKKRKCDFINALSSGRQKIRRQLFTASTSTASDVKTYLKNKKTSTGTMCRVSSLSSKFKVSSSQNISVDAEKAGKFPKMTSIGVQVNIKTANKSTKSTKEKRIYPRLYTGLTEKFFGIVKLLSVKGEIKYEHVLLTLKKLRTNDSFQRLAIEFGYSESYPSQIVCKTLPIIAGLLQGFIIWTSSCKTKQQQCRPKYRTVQSIIDCFEIEIQKPQALTCSEYKKCTTAKFLISSTPSGLVNYVSSAFGGDTSDKDIVRNSGYLQYLPWKIDVLADRGFKGVSALLATKDCTLLRPPNVLASKKPTKQVAALRVHIERVIRRLREFHMLAPHSCIPTESLPFLDHAVIVCCALINIDML